MYLRCTTCHAAVWVGRHSGEGQVKAVCRQCEQSYELDPGLTRTQDKIDVAARELARDEKIDLPGAYSVLFGLLTLDELREIQSPNSIAETAATETTTATASAEAPKGERDVPYDPAFADAVREGLLTVAQAQQRGGRDTFADKLVTRHGLSRTAALAVADNRTSLLSAIRSRSAGDTLRVAAPAKRSTVARPVVTIAIVAVLAIIGVGGAIQWRSSTAPSAGPSIAIDRDHAGRVLEVRAPDARSVLDAYCRATACEALDLMPADTDVSRRIGILTSDPDAETPTLLSIEIRRSRRTGRWSAGTGVGAIETAAAPDDAEQIFGVESSQD